MGTGLRASCSSISRYNCSLSLEPPSPLTVGSEGLRSRVGKNLSPTQRSPVYICIALLYFNSNHVGATVVRSQPLFACRVTKNEQAAIPPNCQLVSFGSEMRHPKKSWSQLGVTSLPLPRSASLWRELLEPATRWWVPKSFKFKAIRCLVDVTLFCAADCSSAHTRSFSAICTTSF